MYSHILVTVAYEAEKDAAPSLEIAKALLAPGGQITLIHVMEPAPVFALSYLPEGWRDEMHDAIEADMRRMAEGLSGAATVVAEGDAAHEILEHARAQRVDCIVIASHRPGTQNLLLGSTASKVVARAQCAVHVARRPPAR
ncbi:universal stress protein [Roseinatronobacter bogoriensis]|uniref:Universal stress protein n=1 Tax=Roseinatronobacter bogoriensis subsp. barguzinensis TaxID=441209 RepID=A0A2K8KDS0_9RHOB|nr:MULTISPECIES: universal stress protein [Rhodobaca]ATX67126.1 universal stress protein [Rhodobaca barguzinensis]MBB4206645.1 nucleotide-binding universal stress UspA family protein [Rhodobaca bogoriensis DSM 18756]TDW41389.1 nucleotide-binding universal stress UspA family protein [Rhodobaca barguzinensis]TDY74433.1 nucleotide-binding universal stress UspA family protein [Rhodobaca bogoriensis DSM 18756]